MVGVYSVFAISDLCWIGKHSKVVLKPTCSMVQGQPSHEKNTFENIRNKMLYLV